MSRASHVAGIGILTAVALALIWFSCAVPWGIVGDQWARPGLRDAPTLLPHRTDTRLGQKCPAGQSGTKVSTLPLMQ